MNDRSIQNLLQQLGEAQLFLGHGLGTSAHGRASVSGVRLPAWLRATIPLTAAAVLALVMIWPPASRRPALSSLDGVPVVLARHAPMPEPGKQVERFRSCSAEDAYAVVVLRAWSPDCGCVTWRVHEFDDGTRFARLPAGEDVSIHLDVLDDDPRVDQMFMLAVARQLGDLPLDRESAASLIECLNQSLPPEQLGEPTGDSPEALVACVSPSVRVIPHAFGGH